MKTALPEFVLAGTILCVLTLTAVGAVGFTTQVSPSSQTNATEPFVAVDRSDGTVYVAWQASGSKAARSDDGGRTWVQLGADDAVFGRDIGDVTIRVGGSTPCATPTRTCLPGTHRVYLSSIDRLPTALQARLISSDDRGGHWTFKHAAAFNPSFIDRPWLAVFPSDVSANQDQVYIAYHDFTVSQIWVTASNDGGQHFGPSVDVLGTNGIAFANSFCNTVPSGIEVDPRTGEVYVLWITADPVANTTGGCNITQIENFHQVWMAHSPPAFGDGVGTLTTWDAHLVFDGGPATNTDKIFATLAVDNSGTPGMAGNVYAVFPDNLAAPGVWDIWFTRSLNRGLAWSPPVKVNSDKGSHFFPWIAAGSTGRVDFTWLTSPDFTPSDEEQSPWSVTFAQTTNGTSATPKFNQTSASSGVMHVGDICTVGIFCSVTGGNRDLADSIGIAIDRGGAAALAWTDQGSVLHGPTHITYSCVTAQQSAIAGAKSSLSCRGPAGP